VEHHRKPEFSLESRTWWYPVVGSLDYRGYFAEQTCAKYAGRISRKGIRLLHRRSKRIPQGGSGDPLLNTPFIIPKPRWQSSSTIGPQRVFASGDTEFNVFCHRRRAGVHGAGCAPGVRRQFLVAISRHFSATSGCATITDARKKLEVLYGDEHADGKIKATSKPREISTDQLRQGKRRIQRELRRDYETLKAEGTVTPVTTSGSPAQNNAQLNRWRRITILRPRSSACSQRTTATSKIYVAVKTLAKLPAERHRRLDPVQARLIAVHLAKASSNNRSRFRSGSPRALSCANFCLSTSQYVGMLNTPY
jgi:predicted aminopeptidase